MKEVQTLIANEMLALEAQIHTLIPKDDHLLQRVARYTFQSPGKQLRPTLVLLAAGACENMTAKALRGAVLVTLLHQASLAHDDVVDEATQRRGKPSINAVWNNKIAILFGDYLLAKGFQLATQHQDYDLLTLITETAQAMSTGELRQLAQTETCDTTESIYLDIIYKKTAHLFGTCLAAGAIAAGASEAQVANMRRVGEQIGMAFQLKDDWLDYGTENLGKPLGMDLQGRKLTLPLIHALQQTPTRQQQEILNSLKNFQDHPQQREEILTFVRQSAGMDYTQKMILQYQQKALELLSRTATSPYQKALFLLIQRIV